MNTTIPGTFLLTAAACLAGLAFFPSHDAFGQSYARERQLTASQSTDVTVPIYKSRIVQLDMPAARVSVGNPDVADILVLGSSEIYVLGKDLGTTNVLIWDRGNRLISSIDVQVVHDLETLKARLATLLPGEEIEVHSAQRSVVLSGRVTSLDRLNAAVQIAENFLEQVATATEKSTFEQESVGGQERVAGEVINLMHVGGSQQVMLEVKVAEINRSELRRMDVQFNALSNTVNWRLGGVSGGATFPDAVFPPNDVRIPVLGDNPFTGSIVNPIGPVIDEFAPNDLSINDKGLFASFLSNDTVFNLAIDAAKDRGLAKILAEPVLTTLNGKEAEFLSGGSFPIPVPQERDTITVEYKNFGVALRVLPVILDSGRINLNLKISVSDIVPQNTLTVGQPGANQFFAVPSLTERRASSTVELGDGQTMGIAGLVNESLREVVSDFPGLGQVPVLGPLFRSQDFQKGEAELVILVTPRLAKPLDPENIRLPTDRFVEPTDVEFYLLGRTEGKRKSTGGGSTDKGGTTTTFGHSLTTKPE